MMIVVFGYPFNKARVNIDPSQFGVSISTPGQGDDTREIGARVAPRRRAVAAPVRYFRSGLPRCHLKPDAPTGAPRAWARGRSRPPAGSWNEQDRRPARCDGGRTDADMVDTELRRSRLLSFYG